MCHKDIIDWLDVPPYMPDMDNYEVDKRFEQFCKHSAYKTRQTNWGWRVGQAAVELQSEGWHPFFVTLTVDPKITDPEQLWKEGTEFRKWLRKINKVVTKELGVIPAHKSKGKTKASDYVKHMAVIEHGKSRSHHHMHALIWMRAIPDSWKQCPNSGIHNPSARTRDRCLPFETLWKHSLPGLSPVKYWRTVGDIWQMQYNFTLPLKKGQPQKIGEPRIAGFYITKYLSKDHKEWKHKVKATRNLGMETLKKTMDILPPQVIEQLTWRPLDSSQNLSVKEIHSVPLGLIRSVAKPINYYHKWVSNNLDYKTVMNRNYEVYKGMSDSVRLGARPDRMDSNQYFDWLAQFQPEQKGYSREKLLDAHELLAVVFPKPPTQRITAKKLGANNIGDSSGFPAWRKENRTGRMQIHNPP